MIFWGQAEDVPIYELLGGKTLDRIEAYASDLHWEEVERMTETAASYIERGFRHAQRPEALPIKIATGENLYTTHGFDPLFAAEGCDYAMLDILRCGGIEQTGQNCEAAIGNNVIPSPHNFDLKQVTVERSLFVVKDKLELRSVVSSQ